MTNRREFDVVSDLVAQERVSGLNIRFLGLRWLSWL